MIITKGAAVGEVVTLKLVTGEELVGKLSAITDTHYEVHRPLALVANGQGLGLQPWLFTVDIDRTYKIFKDKVIVVEPTMKEMSSSYLQGTTGIAV